jgi:hypothetical protein
MDDELARQMCLKLSLGLPPYELSTAHAQIIAARAEEMPANASIATPM